MHALCYAGVRACQFLLGNHAAVRFSGCLAATLGDDARGCEAESKVLDPVSALSVQAAVRGQCSKAKIQLHSVGHCPRSGRSLTCPFLLCAATALFPRSAIRVCAGVAGYRCPDNRASWPLWRSPHPSPVGCTAGTRKRNHADESP